MRSEPPLTIVRPTALALLCDPGARAMCLISTREHPRRESRRLATGVGELDADLRALGVRKIDDALQGRDLAVCPESLQGTRPP